MPFTADQQRSLYGCAELVNSRLPGGPELLPDGPAVTEFAGRYGFDRIGRIGAGELARLHRLRARLRDAVAACAEAPERAVTQVNALLLDCGGVPQIVTHGDEGPHIHLARRGAGVADRLVAHFALAVAELIVAGEGSRMRICRARPCGAAYLDLSRNRSRLYCDGRGCANRAHVAAYRSRRSGQGR